MLSSFRAAALSAHLRPQPHSRPAAGTTNNLWWAVVDFLAELPQAGFPYSGEVLEYRTVYYGAMHTVTSNFNVESKVVHVHSHSR